MLVLVTSVTSQVLLWKSSISFLLCKLYVRLIAVDTKSDDVVAEDWY